ncbi:MAG: DUF3422 domain-containing protein [Acetobacteraceae bacterium]|nr:DUF3422 domain-containing protein [Acetobacteraceae bacterium]
MHAFPTHPAREALSGELHARPAIPIRAPARISRLAMLSPDRAAEEAHLAALCTRHGVEPPKPGATFFLADLGKIRLRFERHTEFTGWNFSADGADPGDPFGEMPIAELPPEWLATLPGQAIAAVHLTLADAPAEASGFAAQSLCGASVAEGAALAFTDFRLHADGFTHILLAGCGNPALAGRLAQNLWEIETYRQLALLALPAARAVGGKLAAASERLSALAAGPAEHDLSAERQALTDLAEVAADIEHANALTAERFSAALAYHRLVQRRLAELGEAPLPGLPTLSRFLERRLDPAIATVTATGARIAALSVRAGRAVDLLRTRVALAQEAQAERQLAALADTGRAQLRLQQTVEGLSAAAISYYVLSLLGYAIKPLPWGAAGLQPETVLAALVPPIAGFTWYMLRRRRGG